MSAATAGSGAAAAAPPASKKKGGGGGGPAVATAPSAVEVAVTAMRHQPRRPLIQCKGCRELADAAYNANTGEKRRELEEKWGVLDAVLCAMKNHRSAAAVQEQGCRALLNLITSCAENRAKAGERGAIESVVAGMTAHPSNADVQYYGCEALRAAVSGSRDNQRRVADAGGLAAAIDALRGHPEDPELQESACGALWSAVAGAPAGKTAAAAAGAAAAAAAAMCDHPDDEQLQFTACGVLRRTVTAASADAAAKVAALALATHPSAANIAEEGCAALSESLRHASAAARAALETAVSMAARVVATMSSHTDSAAVQEHACRALLNLTAGCDTAKACAAKAHAVNAVVKAMATYPTSAAVQESACGALWNISSGGGDEAKSQCADAGAVEAVVKAMAAHATVPGVQANACGALRNMTLGCEPCQRRMCECCGIEAVVSAINKGSANRRLNEEACAALANVAAAALLRASESGAAEAVCAAMRAFPDSQSVMMSGCQVLRWCAEASTAALLRTISAGAVDAAASALSSPTSADSFLLERAACALRELSLHERSHSAFGPHIQAIVAAIASRPQVEPLRQYGYSALARASATAADEALRRECAAAVVLGVVLAPGCDGVVPDPWFRALTASLARHTCSKCASCAAQGVCSATNCASSEQAVHCVTRCDTCGGGTWVCGACAARCHAGHMLSPAFVMPFASCLCATNAKCLLSGGTTTKTDVTTSGEGPPPAAVSTAAPTAAVSTVAPTAVAKVENQPSPEDKIEAEVAALQQDLLLLVVRHQEHNALLSAQCAEQKKLKEANEQLKSQNEALAGALAQLKDTVASVTTAANECAVCHRSSLFACAKCARVHYCSRSCQKAHWRTHKQQCGAN
eukprot:TRINITY_DN5825_c0_g1_i1.p1 TRINITY_DN5825_c0_g1~~TRINITY_DN5825_c0_g1_i1.p1  ORF type:complete len:887 (+),score=205.56 TRINITY_DN5825_c0_g1_i1:53-2662(+)